MIHIPGPTTYERQGRLAHVVPSGKREDWLISASLNLPSKKPLQGSKVGVLPIIRSSHILERRSLARTQHPSLSYITLLGTKVTESSETGLQSSDILHGGGQIVSARFLGSWKRSQNGSICKGKPERTNHGLQMSKCV